MAIVNATRHTSREYPLELYVLARALTTEEIRLYHESCATLVPLYYMWRQSVVNSMGILR